MDRPFSVALQRYPIKAFDPQQKLTAEEADKNKNTTTAPPAPPPAVALIVSTEEGKARAAKSAAANYVFNERKMLDAPRGGSRKTAMDDGALRARRRSEEADGRFATPEAKAAMIKVAAADSAPRLAER